MTTLNEIQKFLAPRKLAIAGASRNEKKFGGYVLKELKQKGFDLYPVNPHTNEIQGIKCYNSVTDLPGDVKNILIVTAKSKTESVVTESIDKGIEMIWMQQGAETDNAVEVAQKAGIPVINKKCIMMFATPVNSIHGFHRLLTKVFGGYPKMIHNHA